MSKAKIILASVGGVVLVAALVLGYLIWSESSAKGEALEERDVSADGAARLIAAETYPGPKGVQSVVSNGQVFAAWRAGAQKVAAAADRAYPAVTPPAFKQMLTDWARAYAARPGTAPGNVLVKNVFSYGFGDYIVGGKLPAAADLPRLQREWDDVSWVLDLVADHGAQQVLDLALDNVKAEKEEERASRPGRFGKKKPAKKAAREEASEAGPAVTRFTVEFLADPVTFTDVVNALSTATNRFAVIEDFRLVRETDDLAEKLGAGEKKEAAQARGGRRGRRGAAAAEKAAEEEAAKQKLDTVVTDPKLASPFKVMLKLAIYDFRTREKPAADVHAEEE